MSKPDILAPGMGIMAPNAKGSLSEKQNKKLAPFVKLLESGSAEKIQAVAGIYVKKGKLPQAALSLPDPSLRKVLERFFPVEPTLGQIQDSPAYIAHDGTSEAAPIVSGVVANMFEANPDLTPKEVRDILYSTALPLSGDSQATGHGAIDAQAVLTRAAESAKTTEQ